LPSNSNKSAYILAKCEPGFEEQVFNSLKKITGVKEIDQVYGSPHDIVVKIKCDTLRELNSTVWRIRRINRMRFTQTLLIGDFA
jgi:DNA-binding Lrp family transcriptional regulator